MKKISFLYTVIASVLVAMPSFAEYAPNIRLDPAMDATVRRICIRNGIPIPTSLYFQPVNVAELNAFLSKADSLYTAGQLSAEEAFQMRQMRELFVDPRHIAGWRGREQDKSVFVNLSLLGEVSPSLGDSLAFRGRGTISPGLSGNIGNLSFYSGIDVWTDWYTDTLFRGSNYQPYNGIPFNLYNRADSGHLRSADLPRGGVRYHAQNVELETGIDYLRIGPAVYFPLLLSGNAPPITHVRARWEIGPFVYTHMAGQLESQKDKSKYLYIHRLDFPLWKDRINIGVNEAIVNGSTTDQYPASDSFNALRRQYYGQTRGWEWAYLIPFVPFKFSEHYLGDRDNALISFDADVRYPKNFRGYVEVLIDDMLAPWKALTDDWGNKWAFTLGGQYFGRVREKDVTATLEYSRVEPWVYTHFYGGSHNYAHFGQCLGMPLGPDADAFVFAVQTQISPRNCMGFQVTNTRKNSSVRGGGITDVFQDSLYAYNDSVIKPLHPDSWKKHFLGLGTATSTRLGISWKFAPFGVFKVDALIEYEFSGATSGVYGHASGGFVF